MGTNVINVNDVINAINIITEIIIIMISMIWMEINITIHMQAACGGITAKILSLILMGTNVINSLSAKSILVGEKLIATYSIST